MGIVSGAPTARLPDQIYLAGSRWVDLVRPSPLATL